MRPARIKPARFGGPAKGRGLIAAFGLLTCLAGAPAASAEEGLVSVLLDRAQIIPFPASTETVVVGNPIIADVTLLRNTGQMILTGKGYGETNILFLDGRGRVLSDLRLLVREAPGLLVVQRGMDRESYACQTRCEPTVSLGDSSAFFKAASGDIQSRNGQALGASPAPH